MASILVIEDDQPAATLLEVLLRRDKHQVTIAKDGLQGLRLAQTQRPDLILLDLMLPGLDGFEVCNRLRAAPATADIPVMVISAKSQESDKLMAARVGANAYLTKPYKSEELLGTIRTLLADRPPTAPLAKTGVIFVSARGNEATPIIVNTALALADIPMPVTLVDLRPYSVDHCSRLGLTPRPTTLALAQCETPTALLDAMRRAPKGLRLLGNLEGSGEAGQMTRSDIHKALDMLLMPGAHVLLELPLYPIELLREAATRCWLVVLVASSDPSALAATRSAMNVLERFGLSHQVSVVLVGPEGPTPPPAANEPVPLERSLLATLPPDAPPDHPAFRVIAERLRESV